MMGDMGKNRSLRLAATAAWGAYSTSNGLGMVSCIREA